MIEDNFLVPFFDAQFLVKAFLLLFLVFYLFFSILLIRQVQIMSHSLRTDINPILKFGAFGNLLLAVVVLIFAIFA